MQTTAKIALFAAVASATVNDGSSMVEQGLDDQAFSITETGGRRLAASPNTGSKRDFFAKKAKQKRGRKTRSGSGMKGLSERPNIISIVKKDLEGGGYVKTIAYDKGEFILIKEVKVDANRKRTQKKRKVWKGKEPVEIPEAPTTTKPTTTCTEPGSVKQCGQCLSNEQCESGKCCPVTKNCQPLKWWQKKACRGPVAGCRGDKCRNKDYPLKWSAPTCPEKQSDETTPEETDNTEDDKVDNTPEEEITDETTDEATEDDIADEVEDEATEDDIADEVEDEATETDIADETEDGIVDEDDAEDLPSDSVEDAEEEDLVDENAGQLMMGEVERAAFIEHNRIRTNPEKIIPIVEDQISRFDSTGMFMQLENKNVRLQTNEGIGAWTEALEVLQKQGKFEPFQWNDYLALAAQDHCNDQGPKGATGHDSSDGRKFVDRINKYGKWGGGAGENLAYSSDSGNGMIVQLYIDDGVPNRGHRVNMLNPDFELVGMAHCGHDKYGGMLAVAYATTFEPNELALSEAEGRKKN